MQEIWLLFFRKVTGQGGGWVGEVPKQADYEIGLESLLLDTLGRGERGMIWGQGFTLVLAPGSRIGTGEGRLQ